MLQDAIQESLQTKRFTNSDNALGSAGPSRVRPSPAAVLRATAERRLSLGKNIDVDDSAMSADSDSDESEKPATHKGKAKQAADSTSTSQYISLIEKKRQRRLLYAERRATRKENEKEERLLRAQLGRKLTWVSFSFCHFLLLTFLLG
jgi:hypothetical protein